MARAIVLDQRWSNNLGGGRGNEVATNYKHSYIISYKRRRNHFLVHYLVDQGYICIEENKRNYKNIKLPTLMMLVLPIESDDGINKRKHFEKKLCVPL